MQAIIENLAKRLRLDFKPPFQTEPLNAKKPPKPKPERLQSNPRDAPKRAGVVELVAGADLRLYLDIKGATLTFFDAVNIAPSGNGNHCISLHIHQTAAD